MTDDIDPTFIACVNVTCDLWREYLVCQLKQLALTLTVVLGGLPLLPMPSGPTFKPCFDGTVTMWWFYVRYQTVLLRKWWRV